MGDFRIEVRVRISLHLLIRTPSYFKYGGLTRHI